MSQQDMRERIKDLTEKVDGLVELEIGERLPFVCAILVEDKLGLFTNRRSTEEVIEILEACLRAARENAAKFEAY